MAPDPSAGRRRVGQVQDSGFLPHVRLFVGATARLSAASRCCGAETKYGPRSWNSLRHTGKQTGNLNFRPVQKFARLKYAQLHSEQGNLFSGGLWAAGEQHNASGHSFSIRSYKAQRKHSLSRWPTFSSRDSRAMDFPRESVLSSPLRAQVGHTLPSEQAVGTGSGHRQPSRSWLCSSCTELRGFLSEQRDEKGGKRCRMKGLLLPPLPTGPETWSKLLTCCALPFPHLQDKNEDSRYF